MADRGVNQVVLLGRLACDADEKHTSGGVPYCWLKLAVNTEQPRKGGEMQPQKTEYVRAVYYNCSGVLPYLKSGRQVHIQGRLESYQKDSDSPLQMSVNVDRLILTGDRPAANGQDLEEYVKELQDRNANLANEAERLAAELGARDAPRNGHGKAQGVATTKQTAKGRASSRR
jgi:single-stranded DNA-binding protein